MTTNIRNGKPEKKITATTMALKAARILKNLSRKEAGELLNCSPKTFEQIENGWSYVSKERAERIYRAYGYSKQEFERLRENPNLALANAKDAANRPSTICQKPRRNFYKRIQKENRVIRVLRKRAGLTQYEASEKCGYAPSCASS